jgi:hypothetical protein
MWARNLLLVGVLVAGAGTLASYWPRAGRQAIWDRAGADAVEQADFQTTLAEVNGSFQDQWTDHSLQPAGRADDLTIVRRISLALTGTIPSIEEIRLLQAHPAEHRVDWWVQRLLEDRRSADYLAERLARAYVGTAGGQFLIFRRTRFVSWLADELAVDRPYDELVRSLIATDGLWTSTPATNFITAGIKPDSDVGVQENVMAARVARAFLGVRLDCAECHDHPFNPQWQRADFHGLAAFFGTAQQTFRGIRDVLPEGVPGYSMQDLDTLEYVPVEPAVPFQPELMPAEGKVRARLAAWVTHPENKAFGRATANRMWAVMFGRPLVEPVDDIPVEGEVPAALDILAEDFVAHGYDLQRLIHLIAASRPFQLDSQADPSIPGHEVTEAHEECWAAFPVIRQRPEQLVGALLQCTSLETNDGDANALLRFVRFVGKSQFVERYGDLGDDEFSDRGGTIPQRLLMMNGEVVRNNVQSDNPFSFFAAVSQVARLAPTDEKAVETCYLAVLTRLPTPEEATHFKRRLCDTTGEARRHAIEDLYWDLVNSTEFSWNH